MQRQGNYESMRQYLAEQVGFKGPGPLWVLGVLVSLSKRCKGFCEICTNGTFLKKVEVIGYGRVAPDLPSLKLTAKAPENGCLEYDRFLLGWPIFRCFCC